jgi:lysozyme family protein
MADVNAAIDYTLQWEDSTLSGKITVDSGGRTRFGIAERFHPELTNCLYYTTMGQIAALQIARGIYELSYAQPLCILEMASQDVANKVLSLGVNIGVTEAAKMLQQALHIPGDGRIGPLTLHALDIARPEEVLEDLRAEAEHYYEALVEEKPQFAIYKAGWLKRAEA